jgi:hypothetical protein
MYFPDASGRYLYYPPGASAIGNYKPYSVTTGSQIISVAAILLDPNDKLVNNGSINYNNLTGTTPNKPAFLNIPGKDSISFEWTDGINNYSPGDPIPSDIGTGGGGETDGSGNLGGGGNGNGVAPSPFSSQSQSVGTQLPNGLLALLLYPAPIQNIPCFKEDTKILTDKGYKQIKDLRKGDMVKTLKEGYRPVKAVGYTPFQNNPSHNRIKNQLYIYQRDKFPELIEDLVLTGSHSVLVKELMGDQRKMVSEALGQIFVTEGRYRLPAYIDERSEIYQTKGPFNVYHLCLEGADPKSNHGIYANGLLAESCFIRELKTDRWTLL